MHGAYPTVARVMGRSGQKFGTASQPAVIFEDARASMN